MAMKQMTADQFKEAVGLDPAWASKLTEPVAITDFCDMSGVSMSGSKISHLSPLLHFIGKDKYGDSASFRFCKSLKVAEGRFSGPVDFTHSGIERIGDLTCGKDARGNSTRFYNCKSLKVAEGKFEGWVDFSYSGIEEIGDLTCVKDSFGTLFSVHDCYDLKSIPIRFDPKEVRSDEPLMKKLKSDRLREACKKPIQCEVIWL